MWTSPAASNLDGDWLIFRVVLLSGRSCVFVHRKAEASKHRVLQRSAALLELEAAQLNKAQLLFGQAAVLDSLLDCPGLQLDQVNDLTLVFQ